MFSTRYGFKLIIAATAAAAVAASVGVVGAQVASNSPRERFTAFAVNMTNVGRGGATPVDLVIERWTTDTERDKLMAIFKEKGPEKLLDALRDMPRVGTISTPGNLSYDLHYARQMPGDEGGRRIILATDRPIGFWEAANRPRTLDYPFMLIEMHVDKDGHGEGKLSVATKLTLNDNVLIIEDYADRPVMLNDVRKTQ
jgi:hypothetical protein